MKMTRIQKPLSLVLCLVLVAAMALCATGCGKSHDTPRPLLYAEDCALGQGATQFELTVADAEGSEVVFDISTDQTTVGAALQELELIEGKEGDYGLYVKSVNGIIADYDLNGTYWAFYINGEYAMSGVDVTEIEEGAAYALRVEK
ncbi:MAG: DUF4430 domain-containing protein [Oscillospiraceae bacterium]|nr:DUF4430 domain-containing protein [Oscillospiraceae bacterium]